MHCIRRKFLSIPRLFIAALAVTRAAFACPRSPGLVGRGRVNDRFPAPENVPNFGIVWTVSTPLAFWLGLGNPTCSRRAQPIWTHSTPAPPGPRIPGATIGTLLAFFDFFVNARA